MLPTTDEQESERILLERSPDEHREAVATLNAQFVRSASFRRLADVTVYTLGCSGARPAS